MQIAHSARKLTIPFPISTILDDEFQKLPLYFMLFIISQHVQLLTLSTALCKSVLFSSHWHCTHSTPRTCFQTHKFSPNVSALFITETQLLSFLRILFFVIFCFLTHSSNYAFLIADFIYGWIRIIDGSAYNPLWLRLKKSRKTQKALEGKKCFGKSFKLQNNPPDRMYIYIINPLVSLS